MLEGKKRVQLFLNMGKRKSKTKPASYAVMSALSRVQVIDVAEERDGFEMNFTLGKQQAKDYELLQSGVFTPDTKVAIGVIINGSSEVLISGVINKLDIQSSNEPGMSTVTVTGQGISEFMDREEKRDKEGFVRLATSEIVRKVINSYAGDGLTVKAIKDTKDPQDEHVRIPRQVGRTDLHYVQELAKRYGYVFYTEPDPSGNGDAQAYWGPENRQSRALPALTMNMGAATNATTLSFSQDARTPVNAKGARQDPEKKKSNAVSPDARDTELAPLAKKTPSPLRTILLYDIAKFDQGRAAVALRTAEMPQISSVSGQGEVDIVHYPHILKAGGVVVVRGAGFLYDGSYYIERVTHSIERGKYTQSFSLTRDGVGAQPEKGVPG